MSKKLAIKGHATRGKEIVELFKMMGGKNRSITGRDVNKFYCVPSEYICWYWIESEETDKYKIFTLEEFLEKYPFKVGDKVVYTKFGDHCDEYPVIIESMKWTGTTIEYTFNDCVTCLAKDLKMWNGELDTVISGIYLNNCDYADEVELNLGDYKIEVRGGRTFAVKKKPKYPTTFEECLNRLYSKSTLETIIGHKAELLFNLEMLLICRDAYWKIAGEEIRLDKPWEPDWNESKPKYTIVIMENKLVVHHALSQNHILAFPTEEMRDAFYENFKDLIERCKELL